MTDKSSYDKKPSPTSASANSSVTPVSCPKPPTARSICSSQLFAGHDFNVPTTELAGQADILAASADSQGELILPHENDCPPHHFAENDLVDRRRAAARWG